MVENVKAGTLIEPGNVNQLVDALIGWEQDNTALQDFRHRTRTVASDMFGRCTNSRLDIQNLRSASQFDDYSYQSIRNSAQSIAIEKEENI